MIYYFIIEDQYRFYLIYRKSFTHSIERIQHIGHIRPIGLLIMRMEVIQHTQPIAIHIQIMQLIQHMIHIAPIVHIQITQHIRQVL